MLTPPVNKTILCWLLAVSLLLLTLIVYIVFITGNNILDEKVFNFVDIHRTAGRTSLMKSVSLLGNHNFLIPANILFIIYFITRKNKWGAITVATVALSSLGLMSLLKNIIGRHRPAEPLVQGITNFSFPSGHTLMGVAFYGLLIWWAAKSITNIWQRRIVISFLIALLLLIGFSRIYLRVHYITDVLAGFCIGITWLLFLLYIMKRAEEKYTSLEK